MLGRARALADGRVSHVALETSRDTLISRVVRVRLEYEGAAAGAPDRLFLKTARVGGPFDPTNEGRREVEFYDRVAAACPPGLLPRCFEAAWEPEAKSWHLLLEDLTDSHTVVGEWPLPPTLEQCQRIVDIYARFHGFWWNDARLGTSVGTFSDTGPVDAAPRPHHRQRRRARLERALPARAVPRRCPAHRLGWLAGRRGHR